MADWTDAVHCIYSSAEGNRSFGTGFVIHSEPGRSYLLTCRHVLEAVGLDSAVVLVDGEGGQPEVLPVECLHQGRGGLDLALVSVDGLLCPSPLRLGTRTAPGRPFRIAGYRMEAVKKVDRTSDTEIECRPLTGTFGQATKRGLWRQRSYPAWDLSIDRPDGFADLVDGLCAADFGRLTGLYAGLLQTAVLDGPGALRLSIAQPKPRESWLRRLGRGLRGRCRQRRRWLRDLGDTAPADSALGDRIFADVLLGRPRRLDRLLPPSIARRLRPARLRGLLPRAVLAGLAAVLGAVALQAAWQPGLRDRAGEWLLDRQLAPNAGVRVQIVYRQETAPLAVALAETLGAFRFPKRERIELPPLPVPVTVEPGARVPSLPTVNTVQVVSQSDLGPAQDIVLRLRRLAWGDAPIRADGLPDPVVGLPKALQAPPEPGTLRVWLFTTGRSGGVFRDRLDRTLSDGERRAFTDPAGLKLPQPRTTLLVLVPFRDPLNGGGEGPEMIPLPGGGFLMGSPEDEPGRDRDEGPQHRVELRPFAIGRTEVTFADYDRFVEATGHKRPGDAGWGRGQRPVINVDWEDANAYAAWLSEQTGYAYRLPSEAEWEYAARAGTTGPFWTGDCIRTDQANYDGNSDYNDCGAKTGVSRGQTLESAGLPANPWGLHEVAGNAWEWTADCWNGDYEGAPGDGSAWLGDGRGDCALRVVRGGGWNNYPWNLRSANGFRLSADGADSDLGFRLARTL